MIVQHPVWMTLREELDEWQRAGCTASMWLRDDDAIESTQALARLFSLTVEQQVPLTLAVVPAPLRGSLVKRMAAQTLVDVVVHGYAHINHEPAAEKKSEFGRCRAIAHSVSDLERGRGIVADQLAPHYLDVLVPPWNRIDQAVIAALPDIGFRGLSTYGPRQSFDGIKTVQQVNCHADLFDWRGSRGFAGCHAVVSAIVDHLAARRAGRCDPAEPTGVLLHHLVHDEPCWDFVAALIEHTKHPGHEWVGLRTQFDAA